ncbi:D-isomer specific 2-hydroxyacid dehydrogenase family protein [Nocardia sp. MDA0666]|uniref:NAD(P)-dependent oxidoreductase n=1 Tax=Nocardia sp. MDA0666 TaxID=2135448 RepID=UPI0013049F05|nr:NAD(P)-dependent oxidoreductase [Nocardia sp. MDA0666]
MIPAEPRPRPARPRILVVDPAPGELAIPELEAFAALGLTPTVNLRRVADPKLRSEISRRWDSIDLDGFRADDIVTAFDRHGGYDALKCRAAIPLTCGVFERLTARTHDQPLRLVAKAASGVDSFDLDAAAERGVTVLSTPGANAGAVAELTIGLMLDALRGISRRDAALRAGDWRAAIDGMPTRSLADSRVGLIGSGSIAREVAKRLAPFGAEVWVHGSPRFTARDAAHWPWRWTATLRELMTGCDIVSVHVPATAATAGLIGARELRWMKPGSILVNTSRAQVVPEGTLDAALRDPDCGLGHVAVDVFASEGTQFTSPLASNPHTTISPHVGGMTVQAMKASSAQLLTEISRFYQSAAEFTARPG